MCAITDALTDKIFIKIGRPRPLLSFIFGLFKQTKHILQLVNVKNVHPVFSAVIQTHNNLIVSLFL